MQLGSPFLLSSSYWQTMINPSDWLLFVCSTSSQMTVGCSQILTRGSWRKCKVDFLRAVGTAIPSLVRLLNDDDCGLRLHTVSALVKLAAHCEFVAACYLGVVNTSMKSSFTGQLEWPFHHSSCCWMMVTAPFDRLWFLRLPSWLIMVSLYLCYLVFTNASIKSTCTSQSGRLFQHSSHCWLVVAAPPNQL